MHMPFFLYLDVNQDVNLIGQNKKKCKAGNALCYKVDDIFLGFLSNR
jgi:hypothetical protein